MKLPFSKMHGLGNDFVVIDAYTRPVDLSLEQLRWIADRHRGVGCDQILMVERPQSAEADFRYRIFNADGGEVAQCGNGARCFARFVYDKGLTRKSTMRVETASGLISPCLLPDGNVRVDMGSPRWEPHEIPCLAAERALISTLEVASELVELSVVSMGNPHAVIVVDDTDLAPVATLGPQIECHPWFPERVNVGFMQVIDRHHIRLRVFERGVGETQACGTGACAAVVTGISRGLLSSPVDVQLPGGMLRIEWPGAEMPVMMTGPATWVFDGELCGE